MAPELIVPVEKHFPGRVTYRGTAYMKKLVTIFEKHGLMDRARQCPLGQFFCAGQLNFSGALIHQLMLHKVESNKADEGQFYISKRLTTFSIREFALITGLSFAETPSVEEHLSDDHLVREYFANHRKITFASLESALQECEDPEDAFKLGLCYLVEGVLNAPEKSVVIFQEMLKFVMDEEVFFKYPWGRFSYKKLVTSIHRDMQHQLRLYESKKNKDSGVVQPDAKYTYYGFAPALQYWAYEALPSIGSKFGEKVANRVPRMLHWSSKTDIIPTKANLAPMFASRKVSYNSAF